MRDHPIHGLGLSGTSYHVVVTGSKLQHNEMMSSLYQRILRKKIALRLLPGKIFLHSPIFLHSVSICNPGGPLVFQSGYHPHKTTFKKHPKHVFFQV